MPWAVAWYGDRQSIWTTLNVEDPKGGNDFYAINDYLKPVTGLYLTPITMDARFYSQMLKGPDWAWGRFIYSSMQTNMPAGFPLGHAPAGYLENGQFFLSHGGFVPGFTEYGGKFTRPSEGKSPSDLPPEITARIATK